MCNFEIYRRHISDSFTSGRRRPCKHGNYKSGFKDPFCGKNHVLNVGNADVSFLQVYQIAAAGDTIGTGSAAAEGEHSKRLIAVNDSYLQMQNRGVIFLDAIIPR